MIVYKWITQDGYTRKGHFNEHNWFKKPLLETHGGYSLYNEGWIHAYEHPLLAVLNADIHTYGDADDRLMRANAFGLIQRDRQIKLGTTKLLMLGETTIPEITLEQRRCYTMLCLSRCPRLEPAVQRIVDHFFAGYYIDMEVRDYVCNAACTWVWDTLSNFRRNRYFGLVADRLGDVDLIALAKEAIEGSPQREPLKATDESEAIEGTVS